MRRLFSLPGLRPLLLVTLLYFSGIPSLVQAQVRVSGTINRDTRWYGRILVTGDVTVAAGVTLSIDPGARIEFSPVQDDRKGGSDPERCELIVLGNLIARGGEGSQRIVFTSASQQPRMRDWYGILLKNLNQQSQLTHCVVEYAYKGITCYGSAPLIEDSEIRFNYYAGLSSEIRARPVVRNSTFIGNDFAGINCELASTPLIEGCVITQNGNGVISFDRSQPDLGHYPAGKNQSRGRNRISGNFDANVYNHASEDLYAQNNSWSTTRIAEIQTTIVDHEDDSQFGRVVILPLWEQVQRRSSQRRQRPRSPLTTKTISDSLIATANPTRVETPLSGSDSASKKNRVKGKNLPGDTGTSIPTKTQLPAFPAKPVAVPPRDSTVSLALPRIFPPEPPGGGVEGMEKKPHPSTVVSPGAGAEGQPPTNEPILEPFLDAGKRQYVRRVAPLYPEIYKRTHHEGKVILEVIVGLDGRVETYRVLRSDGELFTRAAVQALKDFIYKPGTRNGRPVRFKVIEQFIFRLK
ncbi:MAG: TonB family protein [Calditrichaeota bacterium]|nr:MAG: TonB family protein [Calditrichota bacterium]